MYITDDIISIYGGFRGVSGGGISDISQDMLDQSLMPINADQ